VHKHKEQQALPEVQDLLEKMTGAFGEHEATTREHERRLRARLRTLGAGPSKPREVGLKTVALLRAHLARIGGQNHGAGARDAFVFEHLEIASWELLEHLADRAGDPETAELARECRADDDEMAALIRRNFPNVVSLMLASEGLPTLREPEESDEGEREESEASSEEGEAEDHAAGLPQERPGVGVQEAARLQNEGEALVLDVREHEEWEAGHSLGTARLCPRSASQPGHLGQTREIWSNFRGAAMTRRITPCHGRAMMGVCCAHCAWGAVPRIGGIRWRGFSDAFRVFARAPGGSNSRPARSTWSRRSHRMSC